MKSNKGKYQGDQKIDVSGHNIIPMLCSIAEFATTKGINVKPYPKVKIIKEAQDTNNPFKKTGFYDPESRCITLFTEGRHIKDVLRTFTHEIIHHHQNLRGDMKEESVNGLTDPNYAQNNKHLRKLEGEAYFKGNFLLRDFEDQFKNK